MATVLFLVAAATSHLPANSPVLNHWWSCKTPERTQCVAHVMPRHEKKALGFWQAEKRGRTVVYPYFKRHVAQVQRVARAAYRQVARAVRSVGYTVPMLVTYYLATGNPMSNGIYPSVGWAACGYDLPLGTRVSVPGIGVLTCGDRIGFDPYRHIDVFGIPLGSGYRNVTVLG